MHRTVRGTGPRSGHSALDPEEDLAATGNRALGPRGAAPIRASMPMSPVPNDSRDRATLERRLQAARAAMDAEVAALAHERAERLAPLQRELDAASRALTDAPDGRPHVSLASRGDSHVWTHVARCLGGHGFGTTGIVEIAHALGHTDIDASVALRKIATWTRRGHAESIAHGSVRFTAAGRAHYRIDTAAVAPAPSPRPRTPLTVAAAMNSPASRRRRVPDPARRARPPEPDDIATPR